MTTSTSECNPNAQATFLNAKAYYLNAFAEAKLGIAVRALQRFQRKVKRISVEKEALDQQIIGLEVKPVSKKTEEKKNLYLLETYKAMVGKVHALSKVSVRQFLGSRDEGDPRVEYLTDLEAFKHLANVHLEVIMDLCIKKLGITKEEFLKSQSELISSQVESMEKDLCVTGWDQQGNPLFDLPKYAERTKLWPK